MEASSGCSSGASIAVTTTIPAPGSGEVFRGNRMEVITSTYATYQKLTGSEVMAHLTQDISNNRVTIFLGFLVLISIFASVLVSMHMDPSTGNRGTANQRGTCSPPKLHASASSYGALPASLFSIIPKPSLTIISSLFNLIDPAFCILFSPSSSLC